MDGFAISISRVSMLMRDKKKRLESSKSFSIDNQWLCIIIPQNSPGVSTMRWGTGRALLCQHHLIYCYVICFLYNDSCQLLSFQWAAMLSSTRILHKLICELLQPCEIMRCQGGSIVGSEATLPTCFTRCDDPGIQYWGTVFRTDKYKGWGPGP